jgi:hypothetical protein
LHDKESIALAKFRADHYLIAEFEQVDNETGKKILDALKELPELKDLAIVTQKLEEKTWQEILGRIDVPAGSKAFWALVKKEVTEREPYNLFIRFDMNAEGTTIDEARGVVKGWIESEVVPRVKDSVSVKSISVLQPNEVYMPKI